LTHCAAVTALGDMTLARIGLGCMPLSLGRGRERGLADETIAAALDAGVNLLDTADAYALDEAEFGHNESVVAKALRAYRGTGSAAVATKGGHTRHGTEWGLDGSPDYLRRACEGSLRRLGVEAIDLYQLHRPDPDTPYAESVGALRDLRDEGKVRHVGLSNANLAQLEEAERIVPIAAIQNELSPGYLEPFRNGEVAACAARGIPFLAWSPLGGMDSAEGVGGVTAIRAIADERGVSPQQVTLAWLLSLSEAIVPIPGASRPETIRDSAAALDLELDEAERDRIGAEHLSAAASVIRPAGIRLP
jgi:aryl-alcohol dehydrogenase-like predicted oxidoreductase